MAKTSVPITPAVLDWAISESGLDRVEVADRAKVGATDLNEWLQGASRPGVTELKSLARALHRPVATFLLPKPPASHQPEVRFRHTPGIASRALSSKELRYLRRAGRLQRMLGWVAEEIGEGRVAVPNARLDDSPDMAAENVRQALGVELEEQFQWASASAAFDHWREALERLGVAVFQFTLGRDNCRGFSLWNDRVPVIAVNTAWNDEARTFTLFHELGHLAIRTNSACVSGAPDTVAGAWDPAERWCERFAAAALLPEDALRAVMADRLGSDVKRVDTTEQIRTIAIRFKSSLRATAIRLIELNLTTWDVYRALPAAGDAKRPGGGGKGRDRQEIQEDSLGGRTTDLFRQALNRDIVTRSEALNYLDVPDAALDDLTARTA